VELLLLLLLLTHFAAAAAGICHAHAPQASSSSCAGTKISW
jgi:hypothetical protein